MSKNATLFNFFSSPQSKLTSTPISNKKLSNGNSRSPKTPLSSKKSAKRCSTPTDDVGSSPEADGKKRSNGTSSSKKRKIVIHSESEDSGDEYNPGKEKESDDEDSDAMPLSDCEPELEDIKPKKRKITNSRQNASPKVPKKSAKASKNSKLNQSITSENSLNISQLGDSCDKEWLHLTLDWLKEDKIRDKNRRPPSHPDYHSKTLFVPDSFKQNCTPAMRQWWEMKSEHFDTVIFFKVGKFYELYHMDAVISVKELGLVFMKGEHAHSGFPEIAYGRYSENLVQKGYKVARVEQTETPQMMEERCRNSLKVTKFDKVVAREICQITSKGTRIFTCQDGEPMAADSCFLLTISEKSSDDNCFSTESEYGVCFIDTSVGKFHIGQFSDDRHCSRLRTLIARYPPSELLYEKDTMSKKTLLMLNSNLSNIKKSPLGTSTQFWDSSKILKFLKESKYFAEEGAENGSTAWPEQIKVMLDDDDVLEETAKKEYELAVKALSACISYLKECLIDDQLLTMKLFEKYVPADEEVPLSVEKSFVKQNMVLDGVTLRNLEILDMPSETSDGTLLDTMDFCSTNFGKRLFRQWLCSPLCNPKSISDRLDAIDDLEKISHVVDDVIQSLRKLPDLERLLSRIHSQGLLRSKGHPDTRAIFYEEETYNKRKILDFLATLDGFKCCLEIIDKFDAFARDFKSSVLSQSIKLIEDGGCFPDLKDAIDYYDTAFDHVKAKKEGCIVPSKGVDPDYDSAIEEINETHSEFDGYLNTQKRKFQCKITYIGTGRNRFQLEIPEYEAKSAGDHYEFQGQRKGFKRFYTSKIKEMLEVLTAAEERRDSALLDIMRRIFAKFDENYELWKSAVHCLSVLDVLICLTLYKKSNQVNMCRPEFVLPSDSSKPFLKIIEGRHPSLVKCFQGDTYIPNSVYLGPQMNHEAENINNGGSVVLVTGPNMGGKSTLMRQTGLLVIMAQMGSYVPAEKCYLTPVDRIFTRLGASDRITAGESTFFVEVSETSSILQHATSDSLVLIDELGRGTSTYDGTAIACSVIRELASKVGCRTLFSTHYHSLVADFSSYPNVGLGHMACMVEDDSDHPAMESITFLYKFIEGVCPKSYGFNVAHLAGIPDKIVQEAFQKAKHFERANKFETMFVNLLKAKKKNILELLEGGRKLLSECKI